MIDQSPTLIFKPVTQETRDDFTAVFDAPGGPKFCWCMVWRATAEEGRGTSGDLRKTQMLGRIDRHIPIGLVGYFNDTPRGWVSIAPSNTYRRLKGPDPAPSERIWSLACMFVHKSLRGKGVAHQMIAAACTHAAENGATHIEAYPVAADAPSYRFMGFVPAFEKAGFSFVQMAGKRRHVMRKAL